MGRERPLYAKPAVGFGAARSRVAPSFANSPIAMSWITTPDCLTREFRFPDFRTAWAFLTAVAAEAERRDHHPGIWNEYGYVRFELRTHDAANHVTERDHRLARAIDAIAEAFGPEGHSSAG